MTTTRLVLLGVAGLAVVLVALAVAVRHARTVLEETELRTGVSLCSLRPERHPGRRRHERLRAVDGVPDRASGPRTS